MEKKLSLADLAEVEDDEKEIWRNAISNACIT